MLLCLQFEYWLSSRVKIVLILCKFWSVTIIVIFWCETVKVKFHRFGWNMLHTKAALIGWPKLSIIHWSLKKSKVLEQICMFQIKPCTENHHPQCYWPTINNYLLKICPQLPVLSLYFFEVVDLLNAKKRSHADLHWLDKLLFFILRFFSNVHLKIVIYYVSDTPSIARYWRSVLTFKFSVLNFLKLMSCSMSIEQKSC